MEASGETSVRAALVSLGFAFAAAVPSVGARYWRPRFLAVKVPFHVEMAAHFDLSFGRPCYFHLGRRPVGRYVSAKLRFLGKREHERGISPVNESEFASAPAEISIASNHLAREKSAALVSRHVRVNFDPLSLSP